MAAYAFNAINAVGVESLGRDPCARSGAAREQLRVRGLLATKLEELPSRGEESARTAFKKIKPKSLQIFSRQFATMIEAGLNVVSALVILEQQTDDKYLAAIIRELRADVEGGMLLSQAMFRHPKVFNRLYVSMVEAGEAAGILDTVLDRVAFQIEKETAIKRRVKGAMIYPTMVLIFATLVLVGMLLFLVPVFVSIFDAARRRSADADEDGAGASNFIKATWFILFPGVIAGVFGVQEVPEDGHRPPALGPDQAAAADEDRRRRPQGDDGALLAHALDARRRGRRHHQGARDHRPDGGQLGRRGRARRRRARRSARACRSRSRSSRTPSSRPMVSQMVKIGEETGELEKMLGKIADFYEDEVDASIQSLTSIVEPIMMIGVGIMVGVVIISMYLPMFKLLTLIK